MSDEQYGAAQRIAAAVAPWPEVVGPHRVGDGEFRMSRPKLGHLHGDRIADRPFPRRVRDELIPSGRAGVHHVRPGSGWVTASIWDPDGVEGAIALFRLSDERARRARCFPRTTATGIYPDG